MHKHAVGLVWRNGRPVIEKDFIDHLNPAQRAWVDEELQRNGFRWNGTTVEETHGNPGNRRP